nr:diacylglycerol kinase family protein [Corynebacterium lactis]
MRALLISNPNSTTNTPAAMKDIVVALRSVESLTIKAVFTAYKGHAADIVSGVTAEDFDYIVCLGGDGTVNETVNGMLDSDPFRSRPARKLPTLAIIPTGSANVLAGSLGLPRNPVDAAWYVAGLMRKGVSSTISVGHAANRCFVVNAGVGIDAEVIATMDRLRSGGTRASYFRYLPEVYRAWRGLQTKPPRIEVTVDGKQLGHDLPIAIVSNANPWTFLGDLPIVTNPNLSVRGGLGFYGVTSLTGVVGLIAAANLTGALTGLREPFRIPEREIRVDDASEVRLETARPLKFQLDGEYIDLRTSLSIRVKESAIRVVALADDYTAARFTKTVASRPVEERLLNMFGKRLMDRLRRRNANA